MQTETIYIPFKGGIISPGHLKEILRIAAACHIPDVSFGSRQELIMEVPLQKWHVFSEESAKANISYCTRANRKENLVSSFVTAKIFAGESWLTESVYKDVFDLFSFQPRLKINICDSKQTFTPFFSGHLNWISSD